MGKKYKLSFISLVLTSLMLAGCSGNDTKEEGLSITNDSSLSNNSNNNGDSTEVNAIDDSANISQEELDGNMDMDATKAILTTYYFDFDQAALSSDTRQALDVVAKVLRASSEEVRLEGHADERGTREYNLALGERRAKAIANYLRVQGVNTANVEVISYGEEKPAMSGNSDNAMAKNRRVQLVR